MSADVSVTDNRKGKEKRGLLMIWTGLLLIAAALFLVLYNKWDGDRAAKASVEIVERLKEEIPGETLPDFGSGSSEMAKMEIDGYSYIGILDIPSLNLELPVMESWDYERLKISACRYAGSYYTGDLVICAHNYAKHFSPIKWIDIGAEVSLVTADGQVYRYQVSNRETVQPEAVEEMIDNQGGDWDLTLFTCNTGGQTRCAVRCIAVK